MMNAIIMKKSYSFEVGCLYKASYPDGNKVVFKFIGGEPPKVEIVSTKQTVLLCEIESGNPVITDSPEN